MDVNTLAALAVVAGLFIFVCFRYRKRVSARIEAPGIKLDVEAEDSPPPPPKVPAEPRASAPPPSFNLADGGRGGFAMLVTEEATDCSVSAKGGDAAPGGKGGPGGSAFLFASKKAKNCSSDASAGKDGPSKA